jgi:hypothetical protein
MSQLLFLTSVSCLLPISEKLAKKKTPIANNDLIMTVHSFIEETKDQSKF